MQINSKMILVQTQVYGQLLVFLLFACTLASCGFAPDRKGLLIISGEEKKPTINWANLNVGFMTGDLSCLAEDSLKKYSQLLLSDLSADSLNAAQQRIIERFVSQGGQLYFWQVDLQYQHKWPLLEDLMQKKKESSEKATKLLATSKEDILTYAFGSGTIYFLPDELPWNIQELADMFTQTAQKVQWSTESSMAAYPDSKRFTCTTLFSGLNEPMEIEVLPNQDILLIERGGAIKYFDHQDETISTIGRLNVNYAQSNGLNGLALYPDFRRNPWIFLSYSHATEPFQYISRFYLAGDSLIMNSEKVIMKVSHNPDDANHASNALEFDAAGNLYIGFGDYTSQPEGYAPIDERPGEVRRDAQRTAGNSNNPLGGILRIHPEEDGSYSIPEGNLFPTDDSLSMPEIFVKGCRNPYRFSIDPATQYLFFGDVGPDATIDSERGTQGYEEINLAKEAGYFGWPYFVAHNIAYPDYDYANQQVRPPFDPAVPVNDSPNNSGLKNLPPAHPAILWYPRQPTKEFPDMGQGGMNIMVGPLFRSDLYPFSVQKLPDYFDGKLIFYDWVRGWVKAASLNENEEVELVEPLIDTLHFAHPTDMRLGPEGALYVLDYGSQSYARNLDAKVVRISYDRGNRKPVAQISASQTEGAVPLRLSLSAKESYDYDQDSLEYSWEIEGKSLSGEEIHYQFEEPGEHPVRLLVTDGQGAVAEKTIMIKAGNAPPQIFFNTTANRTFYWDSLSYSIEVKDQEDGSLSESQIAEDDVRVLFFYQPTGGGKGGTDNMHDLQDGKLLVKENGCVACHSLDTRSLGPSYIEVAQRYRGQDKNTMLTQKIIQGGQGNWNMGRAMPAHQFIEEAEVQKMVIYILSLADQPVTEQKKTSGMLHFDQGKADASGVYLLEISYQDKGSKEIGPISRTGKYTFIPPRLSASSADYWQGVALRVNGNSLVQENGGYLEYHNIDLRRIRQISVNLRAMVSGTLEVRLNRPEGEIVGLQTIEENTEWHEIEVPIKNTSTQQDLLFVFRSDQPDLPANLFVIDTFHFLRNKPNI
ncbi:cytochrome c [Catalinimonas alkaloidigena]|uniref:PQQ-dependent sugar dehydrogenase n=1 Tax=Catalinimonas alkaloidigena TaxID=1075417 RepID=UPI002404E711|nr:PQQ-dependent sugar dehydrogenase [Catalinimonas alkaloidigena]MDF9796351.1 cytochrome c [Catalinimonas alkaloidigena]